MAPPPNRRELLLDHGRVFVEVLRLMRDEELAVVLAAFVETVRARPPKPSITIEKRPPSPLPATSQGRFYSNRTRAMSDYLNLFAQTQGRHRSQP
jgi:hypothetical protein